jgi:hypothetical protein
VQLNNTAVDVSFSHVSFSKDILPLFTTKDIEHMSALGVLLHKYNWMCQPSNARNVYRYLTGEAKPQMPLGGAYWREEQLDLFKRWMDGGFLE